MTTRASYDSFDIHRCGACCNGETAKWQGEILWQRRWTSAKESPLYVLFEERKRL